MSSSSAENSAASTWRARFAVLSEWAWAYVTFQRRVRLITGGKLWPDDTATSR